MAGFTICKSCHKYLLRMKNISLLSFIIGCLFPLMSIAQITVSPEVGVSYLPFTLNGANTVNESKRIDALFGMSAQLPVHKKWYIDTRISYTNRKNIKWTDLCTCPGYEYSQYKHSDLNLDFDIMFKKADWFKIGMGSSLIRKFIEYRVVHEEIHQGLDTIYTRNSFLYGVNTKVTFLVKKLNFHLMYIRIINDLPSNGNNRIDLSVSYPIGAKR